MLSFSCSTERSVDLFTEANACLDTLGLKRDKLAGVTTKVTDVDPKRKKIFFKGFYEKVAASLEPNRGQYSLPLANTDHLRRYSSMLEALFGEFSRRYQDFKADDN